MTKTEQAIIKTLQELRAGPPGSIAPDTLINRDLGVDGEDAVDLLRLIEVNLDVDLRDLDISKFFGPENMSIINIFYNVLRGRNLRTQPLSVHELANYVDRIKQSPS